MWIVYRRRRTSWTKLRQRRRGKRRNGKSRSVSRLWQSASATQRGRKRRLKQEQRRKAAKKAATLATQSANGSEAKSRSAKSRNRNGQAVEHAWVSDKIKEEEATKTNRSFDKK